jgi:hypothetical protein
MLLANHYMYTRQIRNLERILLALLLLALVLLGQVQLV